MYTNKQLDRPAFALSVLSFCLIEEICMRPAKAALEYGGQDMPGQDMLAGVLVLYSPAAVIY